MPTVPTLGRERPARSRRAASRSLGAAVVVVATVLAATVFWGWTTRHCMERQAVVCMSFDCPDPCERYSTTKRPQAAAPLAGFVLVVGLAAGVALLGRGRPSPRG